MRSAPLHRRSGTPPGSAAGVVMGRLKGLRGMADRRGCRRNGNWRRSRRHRRTVGVVEVTFQKAAHGRDFPPWVARKGKSRIVGSHLGSDPRHLPHDIVTLVIERQLGLVDGFFGTVEAGGTFRSMRKRRHAAGKAAIAANRPGLGRAEHLVNGTWAAWQAGQPTACTAALDSASEAWAALPPGATMTLAWGPRRRSR